MIEFLPKLKSFLKHLSKCFVAADLMLSYEQLLLKYASYDKLCKLLRNTGMLWLILLWLKYTEIGTFSLFLNKAFTTVVRAMVLCRAYRVTNSHVFEVNVIILLSW